LEAIFHSKVRAVTSHLVGAVIMMLMVTWLLLINNTPNGVSMSGNVFYLLLARPLFIIGFSMNVFPIIVGSQAFIALKRMLSHEFWIPFSRLSYGAFLAHGWFMQFREFNVERGQWGCAFDAVLLFLAYLTLSFIFSMWMALTFEFPLKALFTEYICNPLSV
jgi:hypothetical protein